VAGQGQGYHLPVTDTDARLIGGAIEFGVDFSPVRVVVAAMDCTMTSWLVRGLPRQFMVMWEKSRCSIRLHCASRSLEVDCVQLPLYAGAQLDLNLTGQVADVGFSKRYSCTITSADTGMAVTLATIGTDATSGSAVDLLLDTSRRQRGADEAAPQLRWGGTAIYGRAEMKLSGQVCRVKKGA
jgi:hypothetical protein